MTGRRDSPQGSTSEPAPSSDDRTLEWWQREHAAATRTIEALEQAERETTVALVRERVAMHEQRQRAEQAEHDYKQAKRERDAFAEVNVERESARQAAERERDAMKMLADHHLVERQNADHLREQAERERDVARRGMKAVSKTLADVTRERDEARDHLHSEGRLHRATEQQLADVEARLARVPALVGALRPFAELPPTDTMVAAYTLPSSCVRAARAALAEWERS